MDDQNAFGHLIPNDTTAQASGPVYGPPPAVNETQRTANDTQRTGIDAAKAPAEIAKATAEATKANQDVAEAQDAKEKARTTAITGIREVLRQIENASKIESDATLPAVGKASEFVAGAPVSTNAYDLRQAIGNINANTIVTALQQMREGSKTGGALGNVSEGEERMLANTVASLDPKQSRDAWLKNLSDVKAHYLGVLSKLDPAQAAQAEKEGAVALPNWYHGQNNDQTPPAANLPGGTPPAGPSGGGNGGGGGIIDPKMSGGLPVGTDIQFGKPETGPFDRADYLQRHYGMTPDQETQALAFWNQNAGNKALTPENVTAWYAQHGIPAPVGDALNQSIADARAGKQFGPIDTSAAEAEYHQRLQGALKKEGFDPNSAGAYDDRFTQGASFGLSDEARGIGGAAGALLQGKPSSMVDSYLFQRDVGREALAQERDKQGLPGHVTEFAGGLASGLALPTGGGVMGALKAGAGAGAAAGYGYGEGAAGSLGGAAVGGVLGGALGAGGAKVADGLAARAAGRAAAPSDGAQVIQAADRLNSQFGTEIAPMPADVAGPGVRNITGGMAKFPLSAQPIVAGAKKVADQAEKARNAIAGLVGNATENETAGESALNGARAAIQSTKANVTRLYDRANQLGGTQRIEPVLAREALDRNIQELSQTPGGAEGLKTLESLRADLGPNSGKSWTLDGVRNMRTQMRDKFMAEGLTRSDIERRVGQVLDAADQDITNNLTAVGKADAAAAYKAASQAHRERMDLIENVISPIIGNDPNAPKSGEQIMATINSMTQHNNARLGRFLNALPADDQATIRATLISRLGTANKGQQNAAGDAFTLPQFLTQWNGMTPGAKRTLFGPQVRSALDDLAKVAEGTKEAQRFANFSNTGSAIGIGLTGAGATGVMSHPFATVAAAVAQYGGGRLLASPGFARWLAKVPNINPSAMPNYVRKLSTVAAENGAIAADVQGLQSFLSQSFSRSPVRAAAAPTGQDKQD